MKKPLVLLVLSFALAAMANAAPRVGDSSTHTYLNIDEDGTRMTGTKSIEILDIDAADAKNVLYTVQLTTTLDGNPTIEIETDIYRADQVISEEESAKMVADCEKLGGRRETFERDAIKLDACVETYATNNEVGEIWVASVPFGIIKQKIRNPEINLEYSTELKSFVRGQ